jgi:hypothetical protein
MRSRQAAVVLAIVFSVTPARALGPIPIDCDRRCLEGLIDQYLAAVVAHDPKKLPLAADVKYTENDQVLEVGDGFWRTADAIGNYRHAFIDPVTQQAAFIGTMIENKNPLLMTLRLRLQLGRITEVETTYYRQGGGGPADIKGMDAKGKPDGLWLQPIPPAQRASRHQLIATANAYFAGVENNDGKGFYPFTDDCHRIENGMATTNNPRPNATGFDAFALSCKPQLESGYYGIVTKIHHRRFPLVDEEYGVVWGNCVFDMGGNVRKIKLTDGRDVDMSAFGRPSSIEVTEAFRIENGKIRQVEMVGSSVPYHLNPAWGGISDK